MGLRGGEPTRNLLRDFIIFQMRIIEARGVEKCNTIVFEMFTWDYHFFEISGTGVHSTTNFHLLFTEEEVYELFLVNEIPEVASEISAYLAFTSTSCADDAEIYISVVLAYNGGLQTG